VLAYWVLVSLPVPLSLGQHLRSVTCSLLSACSAGLLIVFNFASSFDFAGCSLAQEISFEIGYLPYF
jgi:hypothetical protein